MDGDNELLVALAYWSAEDFKVLQRKMTTAANTIKQEALSEKYSALFTDAERETLRDAVSILVEAKDKVEHAKEIKARHEKRRESLLREAEHSAAGFLNELISGLTLIQKIAVVLSDDAGAGWPYGKPDVIATTAAGLERVSLDNAFKRAFEDFTRNAASALAWDAFAVARVAHGGEVGALREGFTVTGEDAVQYLDRVVARAHIYRNLAQQVEKQAAAKGFVDSIKAGLK